MATPEAPEQPRTADAADGTTSAAAHTVAPEQPRAADAAAPEQQKTTPEGTAQKTNMLHTMNKVASILLESESEKFDEDFQLCMGMIGKMVNANRVNIWKNSIEDGRLCCTQICEWAEDELWRTEKSISTKVLYEESIPSWEGPMSHGEHINALTRDLPPLEQERMAMHRILSVFCVPVFVGSEFWGFVGCDNCTSETVFSEDEASLLHSGSLLIAHALLRNEMMLDLHNTSMKLEAALDEAQKANEAKSDFLANMSHEMRTPLNAVIGLSELCLETNDLSQDVQRDLEKINSAGMTLLKTVNDILDISKIEAGKLELVPVDYAVPSLINDTVTYNSLMICEKPIELDIDLEPDLYANLHGDELRVKQIINNLLSNAIKYTDKGTVTLSVRAERENCAECGDVWLTIQVRDTGKGIKPQDIDKLFTNYEQLDLKTNRMIEGTGLGLPITKRLAEMMNGTIDVESEYGKGSVFTVRLAQKFISDETIGKGIAESIKDFDYSDSKRGGSARLNRIAMPYAQVLVVDDNATNLDVAKGLLKPYGMRVDCVKSGQEAIDAVREEKVIYNAIFMDHMMPGMDGIEAAKRIWAIGTQYAKTVPIIAMTANAIAGNDQIFLDQGFSAFISKPIDISRLDDALKRWVRDKTKENLYAGFQANAFSQAPGAFFEPDRRVTSRRGGLDRRKLRTRYVGLDIEKGINRFSGDQDLYFKIIQSYVENTQQLLDSIKNVSEENLAGYAITVHGIKGSSRGIFADMIGDAAENLELAAKSGDINYVVTHNGAFLNAIWKLIFDLEDLLADVHPEAPKPFKDKPDEDTLRMLLMACKEYDMDGVDAAIAELEKFHYGAGAGAVAWLVENVKLMNFDEIIEKLS